MKCEKRKEDYKEKGKVPQYEKAIEPQYEVNSTYIQKFGLASLSYSELQKKTIMSCLITIALAGKNTEKEIKKLFDTNALSSNGKLFKQIAAFIGIEYKISAIFNNLPKDFISTLKDFNPFQREVFIKLMIIIIDANGVDTSQKYALTKLFCEKYGISETEYMHQMESLKDLLS